MGSINYGNQSKSFDFKAQGRASVFNRINQGVHQKGIYSGCLINKISNTEIQVTPGVVFIETEVGGEKIGVRVKTTANTNIAINNATPYVIFRYTWQDQTEVYMDMFTVGTPEADDVIVGRCDFSGSVLNTPIDYSERMESVVKKADDFFNGLRLEAKSPYTNTVRITSGYYYINDRKYFYAGTENSPVIPNCNNGRFSYVVINDSGVVSIVSSSDVSSPIKPTLPINVYVIGYIYRIGTFTTVRGNQITNMSREPSFINGGTTTGKIFVNEGTDATSSDGAIRTAGGLSVTKQGYFGGLLTANAGVSSTDGTFSGSLSINNDNFDINGVAGNFTRVRIRKNNNIRWDFGGNGTAESGANVGSDYYIHAFNDAGTFLHRPLRIVRSTGQVVIGETSGYGGLLVANGLLTASAGIDVSNGSITRSGTAGIVDIDFPDVSTQSVSLRLFRSTTTSADARFIVGLANNSTASNHILYGNNNLVSHLCANNGNLAIGGTTQLSGAKLSVHGATSISGLLTAQDGISVTDVGSVTQTGSITSAVTLNKFVGTITTVSRTWDALEGNNFTLNNSKITEGSIILTQLSNSSFSAIVRDIVNGSASIRLRYLGTGTTGSISISITFMIIRTT